MIGITRRYNTVATTFYNYYRRFGTNYWSMPYETYLLNISRVYFPKIAYQNTFEPEYTRTNNHAYIVIALIATTLVAARQAVAEEKDNNKGHL
jgi:hypothetical protein